MCWTQVVTSFPNLCFPAKQQRARLQRHTSLTPSNSPFMCPPNHQLTHPSVFPFVSVPTHAVCQGQPLPPQDSEFSSKVALSVWDSCYRLDTPPFILPSFHSLCYFRPLCSMHCQCLHPSGLLYPPNVDSVLLGTEASPQELSLWDHIHCFVPQGSLSHVGVHTHSSMSIVL